MTEILKTLVLTANQMARRNSGQSCKNVCTAVHLIEKLTILIIIIMAGMAVVKRGWLPHRGEAQMAYN